MKIKHARAILLVVTVLTIGCKDRAPKQQPTIAEKPLVSEVDSFYFNEGGLVMIEKSTEAEFDKLKRIVYDTSEASAINRDANFVSRNGDSLIMLVGGVKRVMLVNNNDSIGDSGSRYSYQGKIEGIAQYLVFGLFYEWYSYELIDQNTGDTTSAVGEPVVAPDKNYIICANADQEAQFTYNGLQLYRYEPGKGLKLIGSRELSWGPQEVRWLDNKSFITKATYYDSVKQNFEHIEYLKLTIQQ